MTERQAPADVHLRRLSREDAPAVLEAVRGSMAELHRWMPWAHEGYAMADAQSWLDAQVTAFDSHQAFEFAILSDVGTYLGTCGLNQIDRVHRRANLGYWVRTSACGRGVATAAVRATCAWASTRTDLLRLELVIAMGNAASVRVAEKSGAAREGTLRHRLLIHGTAHDAVCCSFTRAVPTGPFVGRDE